MKFAFALLTSLIATGSTSYLVDSFSQKLNAPPTVIKPGRKKRFLRPPTTLRERLLRIRAERRSELT